MKTHKNEGRGYYFSISKKRARFVIPFGREKLFNEMVIIYCYLVKFLLFEGKKHWRTFFFSLFGSALVTMATISLAESSQRLTHVI